jgi:hypothetical protein
MTYFHILAIVTPFVQVGRVPLKIQFPKPDKAREKNCAAAYAVMTRCGGAVWCGNDRERHLPQTAASQ